MSVSKHWKARYGTTTQTPRRRGTKSGEEKRSPQRSQSLGHLSDSPRCPLFLVRVLGTRDAFLDTLDLFFYAVWMKQTTFISRTVVLSACGIAVLLLSGCTSAKKVSDAVKTEVAKNTRTMLTEQELAGIKDPLIRKYMIAQSGQTAFRVRTKMDAKSDVLNVTEIQFSGTSMGFHTYADKAGTHSREMIILGDTTYVKDQKDGSWWKQVAKPAASSSPTAAFQMPKVEDFKDQFVKDQATTTYTAMGTESCGSMTCYKYEEKKSDDRESLHTFWFDNKQYLLRKDIVASESFSTTNEYSYDNVSVSAPTPTKDVPEGTSIYMYLVDRGDDGIKPNPPMGKKTTTMPSQAEIQKMMEEAKKYSGQ